LNTFNPLLSLS